MTDHPTYKIMILNALTELNKGPYSKASRYAIKENILDNYNSIENNSHFKRNLRLSLRRLEENNFIIRIKQSFRKVNIKSQKRKVKKIVSKKAVKNTANVSNKSTKKTAKSNNISTKKKAKKVAKVKKSHKN